MSKSSETLLGGVVGERVRAAGDEPGGPEVVRPLRAPGADVHFEESISTPGFLVRRAALDLELDAGRLSGRINHLTPDQDITGTPTTFAFSGTQLERARSLTLQGELDRTRPQAPTDRLSIRSEGYAIEGLTLSRTAAWPVRIRDALLDAAVDATVHGGHLDARIDARLDNVRFETGEADNRLIRALNGALAGVEQLSANAAVTGPIDDFDLTVRSELGPILQRAARDEAARLTAELRSALRARIEEQARAPLATIDERLAGLDGLRGALAERIGHAESLLERLGR